MRQGRGFWVALWLGLGAMVLLSMTLLATGEILCSLEQSLVAAAYSSRSP